MEDNRTEQIHHTEAFEFYYALGKDRSLQKVADQFVIELTTAQHWSSWFKWKERIRDRDNELARELANKMMLSAVKDREAYQSFIRGMIANGMEKFQAGVLVPHTVTDIINLVRLELMLTESTDDLTERMEERTPGKTVRELTIREVTTGGNGHEPMDPALARRIAETISEYPAGAVAGDSRSNQLGVLPDGQDGVPE